MRRSYSSSSLIPSLNSQAAGPSFKEKLLHFLRFHVLVGLARYFAFCLIITMTVIICMLVQQRYGSGTTTYSDVTFDWSFLPQYAPINSSYANYTVLLDGHCHTPYLSAEQNIEWHLANGYNAFIVTEHNNLEDGFHVQQVAREKYPDQVKVLVGQEYSCCRIHMNLIGITTLIEAVAYPTDEQLQQVINETHTQGGLVVVNHIPWSLNGPFRNEQPTLDQLYSWGVDYIEIVNTFTYDLQSLTFAMEHNLGIITGTDMHAPDRGVNGWTTLIPANFSEDAIFDELKAHRTSIIYNAVDSPNYENPRSTLKSVMLDPFYRYGEAFSSYWSMNGGMYSFVHGEMCNSEYLSVQTGRVFAGIMWLTIVFLVFEVARQSAIALAGKYKKWKKTESRRNHERRWHTLITNDYIQPTTDEEASQHLLDYEHMIT